MPFNTSCPQCGYQATTVAQDLPSPNASQDENLILNRLEQIDNDIQRLSLKRIQLSRRLNDVRALTRNFPQEVLLQIVQHVLLPEDLQAKVLYCPPRPHEPKFIFVLAAVSSYWRRVLFSAPRLWNTISLTVRDDNDKSCAEILRMFLSNVGSCVPFTADLHFGGHYPPEARATRHALLHSHPERISFLRLVLMPLDWLHFGAEFSDLEELELWWTSYHIHPKPIFLSLSNLPRLSRLKLHYFSEGKLNLDSSAMTHVEFQETSYHIPLRYLLESPPSLICFKNMHHKNTSSPVYNSGYIFPSLRILPHLEEFCWAFPDNTAHNVSLLKFLHLPSLQRLTLKDFKFTDTGLIPATLSFFSHFSENLVSLTLSDIWTEHQVDNNHHRKALIDCFGALPHVRELAFERCDFCFHNLLLECLCSVRSRGVGFLLPEMHVIHWGKISNSLACRECQIDTEQVLKVLHLRREINTFKIEMSRHYDIDFPLHVRDGLNELVKEGVKLDIALEGQSVDWLIQ